jgi:hypothetical protein
VTHRPAGAVLASAAAAAVVALAMAFGVALLGAGCATLQEVAALRRVGFDFDRVSDVRVADVAIGGRRSYGDLGAAEIARLAAAVALHEVPLECVVHVRAENPAENAVTARMVGLDWTFFLEADALVSGRIDERYVFPPGQPVDVPVEVRFDAYDVVQGSARGLFELGLAIAGVPGYAKEVRLEATPTLETQYGPMRSPGRITLRREVGG